ncbi:Sporulation related domain-containing protein [Marivirga sericea]|uniref:Sporulation related domain-containing protein n=1 Tax=Marivirga sericea TaxID=1028 RepID=A0A1X7IIR7_9BACT|nr:SPOR domain-containing protein [Marivirga sericea]SMG14705.1 Sporulation related domain-containing protein [Marivirga sericea]
MAKKDKKDEEYKDENLHNSPEQDDEDFGLPDLDDEDDTDTTNDFDSDEDASSPAEDSEVETSFDTAETSEDPFASTEDEDFEYDPNPFGDDDDEEKVEVEDETASTYTPPKKQSAAPVIITLSIIILLAVALVYFFFLREPEKEPVVEKQPIKDTTSYVVEKPVEPEPEVIEPEEPEVGVVNTLNSRTGRSYVIVGSFFDEDLAKDYADKLVKEGTNAYIIPPFGKSKFNRVAIEETESFAAASTRATELLGQYKEQPWPLKY